MVGQIRTRHPDGPSLAPLRVAAVLAVLIAAAGVAPAGAGAATSLQIRPGTGNRVLDYRSELVYPGGGKGEYQPHHITISYGGDLGGFRIQDTPTNIYSDVCVVHGASGHTADCPNFIKSIYFYLGDKSDQLTNKTALPIVVEAGRGNDFLNGGSGTDVLKGQAGNDNIKGGDGDDAGADGSPGLSGGPGADTLDGQGGNDSLEGGLGSDIIRGGDGNDTLMASAFIKEIGASAELQDGADALYGGPGRDIASYAARADPVTLTLDGKPNDGGPGENDLVHDDVESIGGGKGNDYLAGNSDVNTLRGEGSNDILVGMAGNDLYGGGGGDDVMRAGVGADTFSGGDGTDTVTYDAYSDRVKVTLNDKFDDGAAGEKDNVSSSVENLIGGSGDDILVGNDAENTIRGGGGKDILVGNYGADVLEGGAGNDFLSGGAGTSTPSGGGTLVEADILRGGPGDDALYGGPGSGKTNGNDRDLIEGGGGNDTVSYAGREDNVAIYLDGIHDSAGADQDRINADVENAIGGSGNDLILGNASPNRLQGMKGNDGIEGDGGDDELLGGDGQDVLSGSDGSDSLAGGAGDDLLDGGRGADKMEGGVGRDTVYYGGRTVRVYVSLEGGQPAGEDADSNDAAEEGDELATDIENATGGKGNDHLRGSSGPNTLDGGVGNDLEEGLAGDDVLKGKDPEADTLQCGTGNDTALISPNDTISDCETIG